MAGKKGRSGRRRGSTSWWRNPTAIAGHHLNVLIEGWLGGVPIQVGPERWLKQPTERRYTVPPKIKWVLAALAIRHVMRNDCEVDRAPALSVADVLAWSRRQAPSVTLRRPARAKPRDETEIAYQKYDEDLTTAWKR